MSTTCGPADLGSAIGVENGPHDTSRLHRSSRPTCWSEHVRGPRESRPSRWTLRRQVSCQVLVELRSHNSSGLLVDRCPTLAWVQSTFLSRLELNRPNPRNGGLRADNVVAIPVAAGLLVRWGLDLPMSVGAVAMSLSTIIVAANAQLLRRLKLQRAAP